MTVLRTKTTGLSRIIQTLELWEHPDGIPASPEPAGAGNELRTHLAGSGDAEIDGIDVGGYRGFVDD